MLTTTQRLEHVLERVQLASQRSGRDLKSITLVAVTKTVPLDQILPFLDAGVSHVGENRVQDAAAKFSDPSGHKSISAQLHLIGHLQSNKAKKAVALFDMVQSLDSVALADELNRQAEALGKTLPCLVQIKLSPEETKSGLTATLLPQFLDESSRWNALDIRGLMGIPPYTDHPEEARPYFSKLRKLAGQRPTLSTLSMGMTHDFEVAIEEGATMIRVGTALFGERHG